MIFCLELLLNFGFSHKYLTKFEHENRKRQRRITISLFSVLGLTKVVYDEHHLLTKDGYCSGRENMHKNSDMAIDGRLVKNGPGTTILASLMENRIINYLGLAGRRFTHLPLLY